MKYTSTMKAIDNNDGILKDWIVEIEAISWEDAESQIEQKPYLSLIGLLIETIDENGTITNHQNLN